MQVPSILDSERRRACRVAALFAALFAVWLAWLGVGLGVAVAAPPSEVADTSAPAEPDAETGEGDGEPAPTEPIAAEAKPAESSEATPPVDERATRAAAISERARQIGALIDGSLDPQTSAAELFTIDLLDPALGGPGGASLRSLLSTIQATREATQARSRAEAQAQAAQQLDNKRRPNKREPDPELPQLPEPSVAGPEADALTRAQSQLAHALWRFLTLSPESRAAVLDAHLAKQRQIASNREAEARARARLERLRSQAAQLEALIDGSLDVGVDPASLLRIDLSDAHELGDEQRLGRLLGSATVDGSATLTAPADTVPVPAWAPSEELAEALAEAEAALDSQRLRFLDLDADRRAAVLATHERRRQEAEDQLAVEELIEADEELLGQVEVELTEAEGKAAAARREREQAEAAAAAARSEALRRMGEERARLLGVKEAHANYEVVLKKLEKDAIEAHEIALHWDRDVSDLATRDDNDAREQAADAMYADLRAALADARNRLHDTLDRLATNRSEVESVGEPLAGLPQGVDRSDLQQLRDDVVVSEAALRELEDQVVWRAAELGRDDIVTLNRARLMLLDLASDDLHARMTGFGIDGVAQVEREIEQIGLELRYRLLSLPRFGRSLLDAFERSPLPVVFAFLQLALVILVFRWWRRRAAQLLDQWRSTLLARDPGPVRADESSLAWTLRRVLATGLWYLARVRRPLEWLLLFALVFRVVVARGASMVEVEALWLVILWLLVGSTVILLVDALAAHENLVLGRGGTSTAKLRIRSLRLVGLTIVWTGLMLSLTEEIVGMGAIHKWVRSLVWLAAIPIVLLLIHWWREPAFRRIENDPELPDSPLVRWIRAHDEGWTSFAAAALAGAYLFTRGIARWLLRRATSLELTRRLLAWMFRREVLRQAHARREGETPVRVLADDERGRFDPNTAVDIDALSPTMGGVADGIVDEIVELAAGHRGTLSAVIGERGSGKSTLLRRIEHALARRTEDPVTVHRLQCPPGGVEPLLRAIAEVLGVEPGVESLRAALADKGGVVFLLDDAHRIVRPAIGGLDGLDRLADVARVVRDDASWVLSIGGAAWQYVSRARGERVFFDQVRRLPAWHEREIGELIRERSRAAGLVPNFDEIVIPRQFDVATVGEPEVVGERPDPRARAELGFYRILWDYAKGNPAVALHFWCESLCVAMEGEGEGEGASRQPRYVVRLFAEPPAAALDDVGPTMHFVLRAVVQLEVARLDDLVACTQLPADDVADALRFASARGWIARVAGPDERYRVTWHWYRAITDMLRRQHLLAI